MASRRSPVRSRSCSRPPAGSTWRRLRSKASSWRFVELSIEGGELTPSLKVKRSVVGTRNCSTRSTPERALLVGGLVMRLCLSVISLLGSARPRRAGAVRDCRRVRRSEARCCRHVPQSLCLLLFRLLIPLRHTSELRSIICNPVVCIPSTSASTKPLRGQPWHRFGHPGATTERITWRSSADSVGKQTSTSFDDFESASRFWELATKFGPGNALSTLKVDTTLLTMTVEQWLTNADLTGSTRAPSPSTAPT
jgi:hypothetical protein